MPDREKVMRGLECCCTHIVGMSCGNCPYEIEQREDEGISDCTSVLAYDALALLKQEAVEPKQVGLHGKEDWYGPVCVCPDCKAEWMSADADIHFCPKCGRAVRWDA